MTLNVERRRRGAELETALLDAAWAELAERGYDDLTYDGVAQRARTGRAVLYRRWPAKAELVHAAVLHVMGGEPADPPDTGSLRGDVIAALQQTNSTRIVMAVQLLTRLGDYYRATGVSLGDLIEAATGGKNPIMQVIAERAAARGELDPETITERVLRVPVDLFRMEFLLTYAPVPDSVILEIVDDVFLPLVNAGRAPTGSHGSS
ncbi:TetR/AcrR family transcriptional regulator [Promicromonospora iranensis]|uniref:AcrR family transcriptional regulator n=1 Tax=Promicromonospora iranensis TaxID=1105144 RepID=A0ABU2CK91_9MICO|nr:TetR/AcrR family transcriptional regulator [Promicromonospora iranensis]MDR7381755.1 AcrR family transcriptional regulator [Promicromonospora iranensis]